MAETTIAGRQIRDGVITDGKIAAGAAIQTTKLQHGTSFVKKEGDVAMTGDLNLGNNKIVSLATPSANGDAANKSYVDTLINALPSAYKYRNVHVATTANIDLSNPATSTFDGHTISSGQRVLVFNQSTQSQNGIYDFNGSSSAMTRSSDSDAWDELVGTLVYVDQGTAYGEARFYCTSNTGGTLGSTSIAYVQDTSGTLSPSNFVFEVTPSGAINGVNATYTLPDTPTTGTLDLFLNGLRQKSGATNDYTITTNTISFTTPPISGDVITANYMK